MLSEVSHEKVDEFVLVCGIALERVEPQIVNPRLLLYDGWTSSPTDFWLEFAASIH